MSPLLFGELIPVVAKKDAAEFVVEGPFKKEVAEGRESPTRHEGEIDSVGRISAAVIESIKAKRAGDMDGFEICFDDGLRVLGEG